MPCRAAGPTVNHVSHLAPPGATIAAGIWWSYPVSHVGNELAGRLKFWDISGRAGSKPVVVPQNSNPFAEEGF